jgi:plastocyanin
VLVAAAVLAATGLAACGDDKEDTTASPPPPAAQTDTGAQGTAAGKTVEVSTDPSKIAFEQKSLSAPAGSVTFAFTNQADIPHDFKIEKDGKDVGGTNVVTKSEANLNVDLEPGTYTFYCSVGDHREEGMEGKLTVE